MRRAFALAAGLLVGAAIIAPHDARADDQTEVFGYASGAMFGVMAIVANIAFTAYDGASLAERTEPAQSWMIAQTAIGGASALFVNGLGLALAAEDRREEGYEIVTLPMSIWTGGIAIFGGWSLAEPRETDLDARFGLSFVASTNLAFSTLAIGAHFDERATPFYVAVPQVALMAPECVLTAIKASADADNTAAWAALSVWSGVLTAHGVINLVVRGLERSGDEALTATVPTSVPPPPPDPYYIDPAGQPNLAPPPPAVPEVKPPLVVPAAIPGGASMGPGFMMVGRF